MPVNIQRKLVLGTDGTKANEGEMKSGESLGQVAEGWGEAVTESSGSQNKWK